MYAFLNAIADITQLTPTTSESVPHTAAAAVHMPADKLLCNIHVAFGGQLPLVATNSPLSHPPTLTPDTVKGIAWITEARLKREVSEGKIIDFQRSEVGFEILRIEAINSKQTKVNMSSLH